MSQPNINTPNSDLVSSLSQSQSYLSPNFLVILPGLTSSVRLCGVERCPAQQSEEEEEEHLLFPWAQRSSLPFSFPCHAVVKLPKNLISYQRLSLELWNRIFLMCCNALDSGQVDKVFVPIPKKMADNRHPSLVLNPTLHCNVCVR